MRSTWLAIWLAVVGWDAISPHILYPAPRIGLVALLVAGILLALARNRDGVWFSPGLSLFVALASAVTAVLVPWPERLGFILIASGSVIAALPFIRGSVKAALWRGPSALGALLVLLAIASHVYHLAESAIYRIGSLAGPLAFLFRLVGASAVADAPFVNLQAVGTVIRIDTSMGRIIGHPLALFVVAGLAVLVALHGRRVGWKRVLLFLAAASGLALARFLVMGLALEEALGPFIYWTRAWNLTALLPLVAVLTLALPTEDRGAPAPHTDRPPATARWDQLARNPGAALLLVAIAVGALIACSYGFFDPGRPKPGRVMIDERHSNWAWATVALDTESYGVQTVYNYSEMVRYLGHFYDVEPNFATLTDSLLAKTDVMILKAPTRPYEDDELDALVRFVERGGGLWLIGDHTNVFGMSTHLNQIGSRFGLRYRFDGVIDLTTLGRQLYERPRVFPHPSVQHLPPLLMATTSSLEAPLAGSRVMVGRSLLSDELDYSVNTFFGNFEPDPWEPFGSMLQAVAVHRGRGRVLAFTDSTIFSNFFMFIRGKPELALGSVAWLMRSNQLTWVRTLLRALALFGIIFWISLAMRTSRTVSVASLAVGAAPVFAILSLVLGSWTSSWSELPAPLRPMEKVAFMRERCAFHVPERENLPDESPHSYHTFYIWTQRVGYVPRTDRLAGCLADSDITVIVNPRGEFTEEALERVKDYVSRGGGLLVLDRPYMQESTANEVLGAFGLSFEHVENDSIMAHTPDRGDSLVLRRVGPVSGGEPILLLPDGRAAVAISRHGDGAVVAMCGADNFSDAAMGTTSNIPDRIQLKLYRLQFQIFDELLRAERDESEEPIEDEGS